MNAPLKNDPTGQWPDGELASATDFVRHFGHYAAATNAKPVYIAQHGRVGWALLSAAHMTRLAVMDTEPMTPDSRFDIIIDSLSTIVLVLDSELRVTRMNSAARRYFEVAETCDLLVKLETILRDQSEDFITEVCARVLHSGDPETFDLDSERYPGRNLHYQVTSFPGGLAMLIDVVTQATRSRQASSAAAAAELAIDATHSLGRGRVDVRGTILSVNNNLVTLTQSVTEKVVGLRLAALFEQKSRTMVRDAVDGLLSDGNPFSIEATMLSGNGMPIAVTLGAGPERDGGSIAGAAFVVMQRG